MIGSYSNRCNNKTIGKIQTADGYTTKATYNSSPVRVGGSPVQSRGRKPTTTTTISAHVCSRHHQHQQQHHTQSSTRKQQQQQQQQQNGKWTSQVTVIDKQTTGTVELFNIYGLIRTIPSTHSRPGLPACFKQRKWLIEPPPQCRLLKAVAPHHQNHHNHSPHNNNHHNHHRHTHNHNQRLDSDNIITNFDRDQDHYTERY